MAFVFKLKRSGIDEVFSGLGRSATWMLSGEVARIAVQALCFVLVARRLGSAAYGAFASVLAMTGVLASIATLGWGHLLVKTVSCDRDSFRGMWGQALLIGVVSGILLSLVALVIAAPLFANTTSLALTAFVATADLIFYRLLALCGNAYQAHGRLDRTALLQFLVNGMRLAAAVTMLFSGTNSSATEWAGWYCAATALATTVAIVLVNRELGGPRWTRAMTGPDLLQGFYFTVSLSSITVYNDVDKTLLGRLSSFSSVGVYGAGYRIIDATFLPIRALLFASFAEFFQQGARGLDQALTLARRLLLPSAAYSGAAFLALLLGAPLVGQILGPEFADTVEVIRFLAVIPLLRAMQVFVADALTGAGYQHWRTSLQFAVALGNILANLILIPALSWRGAAIASLMSDATLAVGMWTLAFFAVRREKAMASERLNCVGIVPDRL